MTALLNALGAAAPSSAGLVLAVVLDRDIMAAVLATYLGGKSVYEPGARRSR